MMHRKIRMCLLCSAFAGGLLAFGGVAANAADTTSGTDELLSGTQVAAPINIPINLGATSLGLLGDSAASVEGPDSAGTAPAPAAPTTTSGADGIFSGTQIVAPISVPISLGSTSVGVTGGTTATVVTPPMVTPPAVTSPVAALPAVQPSAGSTEVAAAAAEAAPMSAGYSSAPKVLANTGVNTGMLLVGLLLLAFGGLLTLVLRRKRG